MMTSTTATAVRFFIAVPAVEANQTAIFGIGHTEEEAVADAYIDTCTQVPTVDQGTAPSRYVDGDTETTWTVTTTQGTETHYSEADADHQVQANSFVAQECTERLFLSVQEGSVDRWTTNNRLQDLDLDEDELAEMVDHVTERFANLDGEASAGWMAEHAYSDAIAFVDCYVRDGNGDLVAKPHSEMHTALCLVVRDLILAQIEEREAA